MRYISFVAQLEFLLEYTDGKKRGRLVVSKIENRDSLVMTVSSKKKIQVDAV